MLKKFAFLILLGGTHTMALGASLLIGIVGGSGSGKTTLANNMAEIHKGNVTIISQDSYYKDLSHLPLKERANTNFDAPDAIDFEALLQDMKDLKAGKTIQKPLYDFANHTRKKQGEILSPRDIIIIEGILLFTNKELRDLLDIKIFVDASPEERLLRRIDRDIKERGRTFQSVQKQYLETVAPMYEEHVLPTKKYANIIVPNGRGNTNRVAFEMLISNTHAHLNEKHS